MFTLFGRIRTLRTRRQRSQHRIHRRPLTLEVLEDRCLPSVVINEFPVPTPGSQPRGIATGPDGNLWFTEQIAGKIGRITPAGTVTEFPLPHADSVPALITAGPDGNLWFAESGAEPPGPTNPGPGVSNHIGRITPSGTISESPPTAPGQILTLYSGPWAITAGPDGNLWFTEIYNNGVPNGSIGRITPNGGGLLEFPIPTPNSYPNAITQGPDGNLWFTETGGNKVGRITPAGVITEFTIPTGGARPYGITSGPDGNLWFTESASGNVGRITPTGVITEFHITGGSTATFGITAGPDGNLWLTKQVFGSDANGQPIENDLFRVSPAGQLTAVCPVPTANSGPDQITVGPDGNLWFTELFGNKIGQLILNQPPVANAGGPYTIYAGNSLTLDGSRSTDPDGDPLTYSWDSNGDGVYGDATGVSPTLTWSQLQALGIGAGTFNVSVQVDDGHGNVVTSPVTTLTVQPVPTAITLIAPAVTYGADGMVTVAVTNTATSATPTGVVSLSVDGNAYSGNLNGGLATFDVGVLNAGDHNLAASYAAQDIFAASTATGTLHVDKATPTFTNLTSTTLVVGAATTTLSGSLTTPSAIPAGATVTITAGTASTTAVVQADGSFSASLPTAALAVGAYAIGYRYGGDSNFNAAADSGTLDVTYGIALLFDNSLPVQSGGTLSILLQLTDSAGNDLSAPSVTVHADYLVRASDPNQTQLPVPSPGNAQPGNNFKYDSGAERFNLKTRGLAPDVYELFFSIAGDPVEHFVSFRVK
jgi:streptogramin lyase